MSLPTVTHLQFLVIVEILAGATRGRDLRERLKKAGVRQSGPAFYQMMASLEDNGFVSGWYEQQVIDSQILRERHYKVLAAGRKAAEASHDFYRAINRRDLGLGYVR
jgi:DNA-binding PadR family transcriptional regulator